MTKHDEHRDVSEAGPSGPIYRDDTHQNVSESGNAEAINKPSKILQFRANGLVRVEFRKEGAQFFVDDAPIANEQMEQLWPPLPSMNTQSYQPGEHSSTIPPEHPTA